MTRRGRGRASGKARVVLAGLAAMLAAVPARAEPLRVVATIKPVHSLVAAVMAGVGAPVLLVEGQASPHSFALKPSGARAVAGADIVFRVSETVEPFTHKIAEGLSGSAALVTLAEAPGVDHLPRRLGAAFEPHAHHGGEPHEHAHEAKHGTDDTGDDGHVWLDPVNAKAMADAIAAVLAARDPEHAAAYKANAEALNSRIDALAGDIAAEMSPVHDKPFIVFHDAAQYFERRFGLAAVGSVSVSPEVAPGARRLTQVRERIAQLGARCVLADPQSSPRLVAAVTEGSGARTGVLDAEGALVEPPGPDLYFVMMRRLAAAMKACLAG